MQASEKARVFTCFWKEFPLFSSSRNLFNIDFVLTIRPAQIKMLVYFWELVTNDGIQGDRTGSCDPVLGMSL